MRVILGADHAGWHLKEQLKTYLEKRGVAVTDLGAAKLIPSDDYPTIAAAVARRVVRTKTPGVLCCGTGVGVCMVANKIRGARAVNAHSVVMAKRARQEEDANILCLGGDYVSPDLAKRIVSLWLKTPRSTATRHHRRLQLITKIEKQK